MSVSITHIGSSTAGENYTLECSVGGTAADFEWLGPHDNKPVATTDDTITVINPSARISRLQFTPLKQSHSGSYICNATAGGVSQTSEPIVVTVNGIDFTDL